MARATWNGATVAESEDTVQLEGNHYFPPAPVKAELLKSSDQTTECPWKGTAHYLTIVVDGAENVDAAWYYPNPHPAAAQIKNCIAFWKGVVVT